jgi:beta-lactam-binding protein with PASTA domain
VISQNPAGGEKVDKGSTVSFIVSSGTPTPSPSPSASSTTGSVAVPYVGGMLYNDAADKITAAGLVATWKKRPGSGEEPGTVIGMSPDAGTMVDLGTTVLLYIAK